MHTCSLLHTTYIHTGFSPWWPETRAATRNLNPEQKNSIHEEKKKTTQKNWPFRKVANKSNQYPKERNYVKTADHMASEKVTAGFSAFVMSVTL